MVQVSHDLNDNVHNNTVFETIAEKLWIHPYYDTNTTVENGDSNFTFDIGLIRFQDTADGGESNFHLFH